MDLRFAAVAAAVALGGCATTFSGSPRVEGGRAACERICGEWKMELAGMVQMGDYSNGCICQEPGKKVAPQAAAAAGEAAAGVWVQMQAANARAANASSSHR